MAKLQSRRGAHIISDRGLEGFTEFSYARQAHVKKTLVCLLGRLNAFRITLEDVQKDDSVVADDGDDLYSV